MSDSLIWLGIAFSFLLDLNVEINYIKKHWLFTDQFSLLNAANFIL